MDRRRSRVNLPLKTHSHGALISGVQAQPTNSHILFLRSLPRLMFTGILLDNNQEPFLLHSFVVHKSSLLTELYIIFVEANVI